MIELIILDVDGTMTDGKITYTDRGEELKSFCVKDGLAIASWIKLGKKVAIITGRESKIVENRAKELNIDFFYQRVKEKDKKAEEILKALNISWQNVAAIGDDLNDYSMLKRAALSFMPRDGSPFLEKVVTKKLTKDGGKGAVREMIEYILQKENLLEDFFKIWEVK
ncbi:MAG: HAD-IIIA family hydrolase [Epsilonproteobacteria bacterium]|nr:HAD-IIIA family hydrolase [Campylobacterota bacterium]